MSEQYYNKKNEGGSGYPLLVDGWRDARKELPDNRKHILVWYKPYNDNFEPDVMDIYFENNKFWYDESKRKQFGGIVFAWQYLIPPAFD